MAETRAEVDGSDLDARRVIEELRADSEVPLEEMKIIEAAHVFFEDTLAAFADNKPAMVALWHAYSFGAIIGVHVNARDEKVLQHTDTLLQAAHQSDRGRSSRERVGAKTRAQVKQVALEVLRSQPIASRADLGQKVAKRLGGKAPSMKTIDRHLSSLETSELPRLKSAKRRRIS